MSLTNPCNARPFFAHVLARDASMEAADATTYIIKRDERTIATVATMDEARAHLEAIANAPKVSGTMYFDPDPDHPGCADAAIFTRTSCMLFSVEVAPPA
jgi:hypothetical protein